MAGRQYITDMFAEIVENVALALDTPVYYQFGRSPEVINSLTVMGKNPQAAVKKYPLVYLVMPFDERHDTIEQDATVELRLIILAASNQQWRASDRMERVFKPTLYPIYRELMTQIAYSTYFQPTSELQIQHTKTDWPHFGDKGNFSADYTDAIDINNLKLRVNFICIS